MSPNRDVSQDRKLHTGLADDRQLTSCRTPPTLLERPVISPRPTPKPKHCPSLCVGMPRTHHATRWDKHTWCVWIIPSLQAIWYYNYLKFPRYTVHYFRSFLPEFAVLPVIYLLFCTQEFCILSYNSCSEQAAVCRVRGSNAPRRNFFRFLFLCFSKSLCYLWGPPSLLFNGSSRVLFHGWGTMLPAYHFKGWGFEWVELYLSPSIHLLAVDRNGFTFHLIVRSILS